MRSVKVLCFAVALLLPVSVKSIAANDLNQRLNNKNSIIAGSLIRLNPIGSHTFVSYRHKRTLNYSEKFKTDWSYFATNIGISSNPVCGIQSTSIEYQPALPVKMKIEHNLIYHYGMFGALINFASRDDNYSEDVLNDRADDATSGFASNVNVNLSLGAAVKRFLIRQETEISRIWFYEDGDYYYESKNDVIQAEVDNSLKLTTTLAYDFSKTNNFSLLIGPAFEYFETENSQKSHQRLGLFTLWRPTSYENAFLKNSQIISFTGYHQQDRYRKDQLYFLLVYVKEFNL